MLLMTANLGLRALSNRRLEQDCDLRAARAVGFRAMAGALDRIHAVHMIPERGLLSLALYAIATHPPAAVRYHSLRAAAPLDQSLPTRPGSAEEIRRHRMASAIALLAWLGVWAGRVSSTLAGTSASEPGGPPPAGSSWCSFSG
jgi:hypothetical protein